jgi:hypothetical protein
LLLRYIGLKATRYFKRHCCRLAILNKIAHNEESPILLQAALTAWKREGRRLQHLITRLKEVGHVAILQQPEVCSPHIDSTMQDLDFQMQYDDIVTSLDPKLYD